MRNKANPISIFDSGLGGFTVLEAVQKQLQGLDIIYLGDHKYAPHGVFISEWYLKMYHSERIDLVDKGYDLVILACNTALAAALKRMQEK